jgi:hypothetical protein
VQQVRSSSNGAPPAEKKTEKEKMKEKLAKKVHCVRYYYTTIAACSVYDILRSILLWLENTGVQIDYCAHYYSSAGDVRSSWCTCIEIRHEAAVCDTLDCTNTLIFPNYDHHY